MKRIHRRKIKTYTIENKICMRYTISNNKLISKSRGPVLSLSQPCERSNHDDNKTKFTTCIIIWSFIPWIDTTIKRTYSGYKNFNIWTKFKQSHIESVKANIYIWKFSSVVNYYLKFYFLLFPTGFLFFMLFSIEMQVLSFFVLWSFLFCLV